MKRECLGIDDCSPKCPLASAHSRLREAHHHWHQALDAYQDPELFRISLNATIQALRNVTFPLQKAAAHEEAFQAWYPSQQEFMKSDAVMRWIVDSRNRVVKEYDLMLHSTAAVSIHLNYRDAAQSLARSIGDSMRHSDTGEGRVMDNYESVNPTAAAPAIAQMLRDRHSVPLSSLDRGVFTVERRWIDSGLPDWELLGALAHAYGVLRGVVSRAHPRVGVSRFMGPTLDNLEDGSIDFWDGEAVVAAVKGDSRYTVVDGEGEDHPPACMLLTSSAREMSFNLLSGEPLSSNMFHKVDPAREEEMYRQAIRRYGLPAPVKGLATQPVRDHAEGFTELARRILDSGDDHGNILILYRDGYLVDQRQVEIETPSHKLQVARELVELVLRSGATRLAFVGEFWVAPSSTTIDGTFLPPAYHSSRSESLTVVVADADGTSCTVHTQFTSEGDPPERQVTYTTTEILCSAGIAMLDPAIFALRSSSPRVHDRGASFFKPGSRRREDFLH